MQKEEILKICKKGHRFYKRSDCPTCPICEKEIKSTESFLTLIAAPARRALERVNIHSLEDLAKWNEQEILLLHGIGPSTIPKLKKALKEKRLAFSA
jgi:predicted RecB family nuclease